MREVRKITICLTQGCTPKEVNSETHWISLHPLETTAFKISAKIAGNFPSNRYPVPKERKNALFRRGHSGNNP